jgi:prolipoprotein diacylglyceryl transferase
MNCELFIHWNPDLVFFHLGPLAVRWYGLCWLVGFAVAYLLVRRLYREQKIKDELFDPLFIYCFMGILIGARLGHCIFYEPDYFLTSVRGIIEMFLPIRFVDGNINYAGNWLFQLTGGAAAFVGYEGLASHGGTLGLMIALWLYVKKTKLNIWTVLDNIAIATGSMACFIRLGNLMNSEIIGKVTDVPWAFIFERVDQMPRHPGQLYEAIAYAILFGILWYLHKRMPEKIGTGWYFGFCLAYIFTFRFFIEYTKEVQEAFEEGLPFDMGQILSIPFILMGAYFTWKGWKKIHNA